MRAHPFWQLPTPAVEDTTIGNSRDNHNNHAAARSLFKPTLLHECASVTLCTANLCDSTSISLPLLCRVSICSSFCRWDYRAAGVRVQLMLLMTVQDDCNEAVDRDIALHLVFSNIFPYLQIVTIKQVHLHQRREDAVSPPISKEELQRCGIIHSRRANMSHISSLAATSTTRKHGFTRSSRLKPASRCGKRRTLAFV
jgi:hypothetical protein